ncbi:MAG: division/cell wall cluster transcriptional repressor MraZ [Planctomycetota bacterium]
MFFGTFEHSLDAKNRLFVPKKFLEAIDSESERQSFYVVKGFERCLFLYCKSTWFQLVKHIREQSNLGDPNARNFARLFFPTAEAVSCDKQRRVVIPDALKRYAGLDREVVVLGVDERMEIWDRRSWAEFNESQDKGLDQYAFEVLGTRPEPGATPPKG